MRPDRKSLHLSGKALRVGAKHSSHGQGCLRTLRTRPPCSEKNLQRTWDLSAGSAGGHNHLVLIHWYQQKGNKASEWMFFVSSGAKILDESFQGRTYTIERASKQKICTLIIKSIVPDDTATYYCAYVDPHYSRNPAITLTNTPLVAQLQTI
uniref:Immunoglobulin V-set domain-containing protein n=1 Tax=Anas platyrhynchos platyrhynchos TaxID=8840 RepID=A0A493TU69_ANAPP